MRMLRIITCDLSCCTVFFTLSHKRPDFLYKIFPEREMSCLTFYPSFSGKFLTLRRTERDMIKNVYLSSRKLPIILLRF